MSTLRKSEIEKVLVELRRGESDRLPGLLCWILKYSEKCRKKTIEFLTVPQECFECKSECEYLTGFLVLYGDSCGGCGPDVHVCCEECTKVLKGGDWWGTSQCRGQNVIEIHDFRTGNVHNHPSGIFGETEIDSRERSLRQMFVEYT